MQRVFLIFALFSAITFNSCSKEDPENKYPVYNTIWITSVTPASELEDGQTYNFVVEVDYNLVTAPNGILYIGFNNGESPKSYILIPGAEKLVKKGSGKHTFNVSTFTKDWLESGDFEVFVNLSEYPHDTPWVPLASDRDSFSFKSIPSPLAIAGGGHSLKYNFTVMTPNLITPESSGSVILEVHGNQISSTQPELHTTWNSVIPLVDNGTQGDKTAGDNIFTGQIEIEDIVNENIESALNKPLIGRIYTEQGYLSVWAELWNDNISEVEVTTLTPSVQYSSRLVNISSSHISLDRISEYIKKFYEHFPDNFDFINIVFPGFNINRHHITVKQEVQGIGKEQANHSQDYGNPAQLKGINVFPNTGYYDGASVGYQHEIGHQWINFLKDTPFESGIPHWPISDLANSIMGYSPGGGQGLRFPFELDQYDANTWVLNPQTSPPVFKDLELYLMGLVPDSEVEPHIVFTNQQQNIVSGGTLSGPVHTVTIEDIVAVLGPRIPDAHNSKNEFKIATIIVTPSLLTVKEMAFYDHYTKRAELKTETISKEGYHIYNSKPFYLATGERATLNTLLE